MGFLRVFMIFIIILSVVSGCKKRSTVSNQKASPTLDQKTESVIAALKAAGWDEARIKQKIDEYTAQHSQDPTNAAQGIWVLGAGDLDKKSGIKTDVIRAVLERKHQANRAIAASVGLTVVGVALALAPLPGTQGIGLLLIKDGMALGVVYYSLSAESQYRSGRLMEVKDLTSWEPAVQDALNKIVQASVARQQIGSVTKAYISSSRFIEFDTSEGFHFVTKDIENSNEALFVSRSPNWITNLPQENDHVLSLIDGELLTTAKFVELNAHMDAALSDDYQKFLHNALETMKVWQETTGSENMPSRYAASGGTVSLELAQRYNAIFSWNLDQEIVAANDAIARAKVQLTILGGRIYRKSTSEIWEQFQTHQRTLDVTVQRLSQVTSSNPSKISKLQRLIDVYTKGKPIIIERAQYLSGHAPFLGQ